MSHRHFSFFWLLVVIAMANLGGCARPAAKPKTAKPMPVNYVLPTREKVTEYEEFTGRTAAVEIVELRARVSGYLDKLHFQDGTDVQEGDLLFEIDNRPFVADEARTAAAVEQYEARVKRLELQFKRAVELYEKQALSQDEFETIKFDLAEAAATMKSAEAQHDIASLNLKFTRVIAPISGRIGRRMVDPGNLVTADVTPLAVILPQDKVYVYFDVDERTVLKLRRLVANGTIPSPRTKPVTIDIALADSDEHVADKDATQAIPADANGYSLQGVVDFQDNQIDPATGTLRMRATVENRNNLLSPGLFVRLRYPVRANQDEMMVPEESLGSDQGEPFVYVIGSDDKVVKNRVAVGPQVAAKRVIRSGLKMEDRVVVTGLQRLRPNTQVTPALYAPEEPPTLAKRESSTATKETKAAANSAGGE